nr:MAG TPA: hypothetical protein [Caudoviricetes sp.]
MICWHSNNGINSVLIICNGECFFGYFPPHCI